MNKKKTGKKKKNQIEKPIQKKRVLKNLKMQKFVFDKANRKKNNKKYTKQVKKKPKQKTNDELLSSIRNFSSRRHLLVAKSKRQLPAKLDLNSGLIQKRNFTVKGKHPSKTSRLSQVELRSTRRVPSFAKSQRSILMSAKNTENNGMKKLRLLQKQTLKKSYNMSRSQRVIQHGKSFNGLVNKNHSMAFGMNSNRSIIKAKCGKKAKELMVKKRGSKGNVNSEVSIKVTSIDEMDEKSQKRNILNPKSSRGPSTLLLIPGSRQELASVIIDEEDENKWDQQPSVESIEFEPKIETFEFEDTKPKNSTKNNPSEEEKIQGMLAKIRRDVCQETMLKASESVKKSFRDWKKTDLVEIYNFKTAKQFYTCEKQIGKGSFGKVFLAKQVLTGRTVALKQISKKSMKNPDTRLKIENEIDILKSLEKHPNVIRLLEVFQDMDYQYLVFEFAELGDLISYFREEDLFEGNRLKLFVKDILSGLQSVHRQRIVHRDIKPDNILMTRDFTPKIADFGISNVLQTDEDKIFDTGGTPLYLAPEVIHKEGKVGFKTDVWCAGIVLYLLAYGEPPFKGRDMNMLFISIIKKEVEFDHEGAKDEGLQALIRKMLIKDPEHRISLDGALNDPWFKSEMKRSCVSDTEEDEPEPEPPSRLFASCREVQRFESRASLLKPTKDTSIRENQSNFELTPNIYQTQARKLELRSPEKSPKFVGNNSTKNTNCQSPVNGGFESSKKVTVVRSDENTKLKEAAVRRYLKEAGFPKEFMDQSLDPEKKIFNHAKGCFEALMLSL